MAHNKDTVKTPHASKPERTQVEPWITVFIHGTMGFRETLGLTQLLSLFKCNIDDTPYARKLRKLRQDPRSYQSQPTQELGLIPVSDTTTPQTTPECFTQIYKDLQKTYYPEQQTVGYYTFGWSGMLNCRKRYEEARRLYRELGEEIARLKKTYPNLRTRIVSYSHGTNVALNLADIENCGREPSTPAFAIDELVAFATPVQRETDCFVTYPFFKKVYAFYSKADKAQIADVFSFIRIGSRRTFYDNQRCLIPDRVHQTELDVTIAARKDPRGPYNSDKRVHRAPNHLEMWLFGWPCGSRFYRAYFPLAPLPMAVLAPCLTWCVDHNAERANQHVCTLQADTGDAIIRPRYTPCRPKAYRFSYLTPQRIYELRKYAWDFYTREIKPNTPCNVRMSPPTHYGP